ncbi:MAG: hypothetical protein ACLSHW_02175, partial [Lachnospiraceae bacterium]
RIRVNNKRHLTTFFQHLPADWHDYSSDNAKFTYLKSQGFNFFCNVDSSQYFLQIRDNYVRQGRRNLDGYRLWNDVHGEKNRTSDLFDATQILIHTYRYATL